MIRRFNEGIHTYIHKFLQKQSNNQPPVSNPMYDAEKRMQKIMEAPQITAAEESKLYFGSTESVPHF